MGNEFVSPKFPQPKCGEITLFVAVTEYVLRIAILNNDIAEGNCKKFHQQKIAKIGTRKNKLHNFSGAAVASVLICCFLELMIQPKVFVSPADFFRGSLKHRAFHCVEIS